MGEDHGMLGLLHGNACDEPSAAAERFLLRPAAACRRGKPPTKGKPPAVGSAGFAGAKCRRLRDGLSRREHVKREVETHERL